MKAAGNRSCIITLLLMILGHRRVSAYSYSWFGQAWAELTAKTVDEDPASCKRWISRSLGRSFVSIVLEIHKREDNEIPPLCIHDS